MIYLRRIKRCKVIILLLFIILPKISFSLIPTKETCKKKYFEVRDKYQDIESRANEWRSMQEYCPKDGTFEEYHYAMYFGTGVELDWIKYAEKKYKQYTVIPVKFAYTLVNAYIEQGNYSAVGEIAKKLLEQHPEQYEGYHVIGLMNMTKKDYKSALRCFKEASQKKDGTNSRTYVLMAYCWYNLGEYQASAINLFKAYEIQPVAVLFSKHIAAYSTISLIKIDELECAETVLSQMPACDPAVLNLEAYNLAVKMYEEASGKTLKKRTWDDIKKPGGSA